MRHLSNPPQKILLITLVFGVVVSLLSVSRAYASESQLVPDKVTIARARVLEVKKQEMRTVPGTDLPTTFQTIRVRVLEGDETGKEVVVDNDYLNLTVGEVFYLSHTVGSLDGSNYYSVNDPYRLPQIFWLVAIFIAAVFLFGGMQGVRGLVSLAGSFLLIFYVLLPGILHGYPPLFVTIAVSSLIIILGSYVTHGFTRSTTAAVMGMVLTVSVTGFLAYWAVHFTRLSGLGSEEAVYLNLNARGSIDIVGLLLGGIIIGLLGVLYDAAIGQAVSVEELLRIAPHVSKKIIYQRALRIGREHIGALVNTLAIAYAGASLPLLLLFQQSASASVAQIANTEIFSTEIVRILIGSIGLVLAIPITTIVSVWFLTKNKRGVVDAREVAKETHALEHTGHQHTH